MCLIFNSSGIKSCCPLQPSDSSTKKLQELQGNHELKCAFTGIKWTLNVKISDS